MALVRLMHLSVLTGNSFFLILIYVINHAVLGCILIREHAYLS